MVGAFRVRHLLPVAALATIAVVWVPLTGSAQQSSVCDQAIAEAGTGQGTYGRYKLVQAPAEGRSGSQVVVGTPGPDRLVGGSGNDVLCGLGGNDVLFGGSGNDVLEGGEGNDELHGDSGNDQLDGGNGFDRHFGGSGNDTLRNGEVNDGGSGDDQVVPGPSPSPPVDISGTMPRVLRDELTGDFLGKGYDQRMRAEDTSLNIYDSASLGGELLQSTPMDIAPPPQVSYVCNFSSDVTCQANTWAKYTQEGTQSGDGLFSAIWSTFDLGTVYLAQNNTNIFMTGTKGNSTEPDEPQYQNLLYVLPGDGSCGSQSCAISTTSLPIMFNQCEDCPGEVRSISVTSLAAGYVGGTPYLAVGLSDDGVQIYNVSNPSSPQLTSTFGGMATSDHSQTPPTALAWDPSGSGVLAIGVMSWGRQGFFIQVAADGTFSQSWLSWFLSGTAAMGQVPLSMAFGQRQDGTPVVAFGMSNGVALLDPRASGPGTSAIASFGGPATVAVNPIPRFDGSVGGSDFAVSYQTSPAPTFGGMGGLLRWDGTSAGLTPLPVSSTSTPTLAPSSDAFRQWYPGIKQGRLQVNNTSGEQITVTLHHRSDSSSGCWYAPSWADATAFPTAGVTVAAGQTSPVHVMGAYTAGQAPSDGSDPDGSCAPPSNSAQNDLWRGYLVITPTNHPADAVLVRLRMNANMTVDVENQAGGATTVSIAQAAQQPGALGLWTVTVDTPDSPTPLAAPTVNASLLTPAETPGPQVYRFDVGAFQVNGVTVGSPATFQLANPYADQMSVPPLVVQGSVDGTTWTDLGALVPATAPTIVASGSGFELQLGPATFWWEIPPGPNGYQYIQVLFGAGGPTPDCNSSPPTSCVTLANLQAPSAPTNVSGPAIAATSSSAVAAPVDTGVDQAPLSVQVLDNNSNPLLDTDPSYARIYYRQKLSQALITNLFGADINNFIGVSPYAGAYSNNGSVDSGPVGVFDGFHYVATTSTIDQLIIGYVALGAAGVGNSDDIEVHGSAIAPQNDTTSAAGGVSLAGCQDFTGTSICSLAQINIDPTTGAGTPAMYLDTTSGIEIGLLTAAQVRTAVGSLPLQHASGTAVHPLATAQLTMSETAATLQDTSAFQSNDTVDTNLVTHGQLVAPIVNIAVF